MVIVFTMEEKMKPAQNLKNKVKLILLIITAIVLIGVGMYIGTIIGDDSSGEGGTVDLSFKDIGELATQSVYSKEVKITKDDRNVFGVTVPFTESKYIYSYGVNIKAGYDFNKIKTNVHKNAKIIDVKLPEAKILSTELDLDSLEVYYEKESIFKNIDIETYNNDLKELETNAKESAVKNGLLSKAEENAEKLITEFIGQSYNLKEYKIKFVK